VTEADANLSSNLTRLFARFALFFEPISLRFVSFRLGRRLQNWKNRGIIDDYKVITKRAAKFHYRIEVNLELTPQQAKRIMGDTLIRTLRKLGR
jgi:hypothetical protein